MKLTLYSLFILFLFLDSFSLMAATDPCDKALADLAVAQATEKVQKLELAELTEQFQMALALKLFLEKNIAGIRSNFVFTDSDFIELEANLKSLQIEREPLYSMRRNYQERIEQNQFDIHKLKKEKKSITLIIDFKSSFFNLKHLLSSKETIRQDKETLAKLIHRLQQIDTELKTKPHEIKTLTEKLSRAEAKIQLVHPNIENIKLKIEGLRSTLPLVDPKGSALEAALALEIEKIAVLEARIKAINTPNLADFRKELETQETSLSSLKLIMRSVQYTHPEVATIISDFVFTHWLQDMKAKRSTLVLAVGNPFNPLTEKQTEQITWVVKTTLAAGTRIIYDADSLAAPLIRRLAGEAAVGVTGKKQDSKQLESDRVIYVENPFLRWILFTNGDMVSSLDSLIGLSGSFMNYDKNSRMALADTKQIESYFAGLKNWSIDIEKANLLGVLPLQKVTSYKPRDKRSQTRPFPIPFSGTQKWNDVVTGFGINKFLEVFKSTSDFMLAMHKVEAPSSYKGHAVFFGSGSTPPEFQQLVFEANQYLGSIGYSVAHGGSKGFMEVAGLGVLSGGGYSIGIPLKPGQLKKEDEFPMYAHSTTVFAPGGYEDRIHLLLKNRSWVIVGAGGNGTIKEFAATLALLNGFIDHSKGIVFLSTAYYGRFYEWLQNSNLPKELKDKIFIVDSVKELAEIIPQ